MPGQVSEADVYAALRQVMHPESPAQDVVDLGMIERVDVEGRRAQIMLALPFLKLPIEEQLIDLVHNAVAALNPNLNIRVTTVQMTPEQRSDFMFRLRGEQPTGPEN